MSGIVRASVLLFIPALALIAVMMTGVIRPNALLFILAMASVVAAIWLAARKIGIIAGFRFQQPGAFLPVPSPPARRAARIAEATVLGIAGLIVVTVAATSPGSGGNLLMLDQLQPEYAVANVVMFACAVAGAAGAVVITLLGRTLAGSIVLAVTLIVYGLVLNGGRYAGSWFLPEWMAENTAEYTITFSPRDIDGAELWVNGVLLGKTPYTATASEFEAKVPDWSKPPADYNTNWGESPHYRREGVSSERHRKWSVFELENTPRRPSGLRKRYYAKVRYAGEWGLDGDSVGLDVSLLGRSHFRYTTFLSIVFPQRTKRLEALLNKARLADYHVTAEWFQVLETYGQDGWFAMRKAADREPQMAKVLDDWATWHYQLDKAETSDSAWQAFLGICDQADAQRQYLTASLAGHAVEMLVPRLPQDRLIAEAIRRSRDTDYLDFSTWTVGGRFGFGYSEQPGGLRLGKSVAVTSTSGGGQYGASRFRVSVFPAAHAVWKLNDQLRARNAPWPNIVQDRIVPELVRRQYQSLLKAPLHVAAYFGGPAIDKFLLREKWRLPANQLPMIETGLGFGGHINQWVFFLALLNDEAGLQFRHHHKDLIMDLADRLYWNGTSQWVDSIGFITEDHWLAQEYWPRFANLARQKSSIEPLKVQWLYLLRIGDAATVDMFVEAWKETKIANSDFLSFLDLLDQLKASMQRRVIDALAREVRERPANLADVLKYRSADSVVSMIRTHDELAERERIFTELHKGPALNQGSESAAIWHYLPLWLAHTQPDSPLVELLAKADKPELRLLVMDALREYPIPPNQAFLEELLKDPDATVRTAAEKVSRQLKRLAAQKPAEYACEAASMPGTSSNSPASGEEKRDLQRSP